MRKHLACQFRKQAHFLGLLQLLVNRIHTLPSLIPYRAQSIPSYTSRNRTRHIRNDESHGSSAHTPHNTPELLVRLVVALSHAFLPHHLLKHTPELLIAVAIRLLLRLRIPTETKG